MNKIVACMAVIMRKIFISGLLLSIVFIAAIFSGCVGDKPESVSDVDMKYTGSGKSGDLPNAIDTGNSGSSVQPDKTTNVENPLMALEPFIDPDLEHVKIESSDPDIEVVRFELHDQRDYESSPNYLTSILVQNNGDDPVIFNTYSMYIGLNNPQYESQFINLESGKRKRVVTTQSTSGSSEQLALKNLLSVVITAYKIATTEVSPELKNITISCNIAKRGQTPIKIHSIKYEETNDKHRWRYITFGVSCDKDATAIVGIYTKNKGSQRDSKYIHAGKIEYIKVPLKDITIEDIVGFGAGPATPGMMIP